MAVLLQFGMAPEHVQCSVFPTFPGDVAAPKTGYTCGSCPAGYSGSGTKGCTDVNDCTGNPCKLGSGGKTCTDPGC